MCLTQSCKTSVAIWTQYLHFEFCNDPTRAVAAVFSALRQCPLAKRVYLIALANAQYFDADQIQQLLSLMEEKEVRMRFPAPGIDIE